MIDYIKEIFQYKDMIKSLVKRELRGKYKGSLLGFLWTFINPLCQIIVYTLVFSMIWRNDLEQFYVYMIVGMIPWIFFDSCLRQGAGSIRYQGDMVKKIYFPREVLPLATVTSNFVNMLYCFIVVFAVLILSGRGINLFALLFLPIVMAVEYLLALGFALLVSALTVFFRDVEHIITVILMAWVYGTPIMYSLTIIPDGPLKMIIKLNPMTEIIESYHRILYWKICPTVKDISYALVFAVVMVVVGELVFRKLEGDFSEQL